MKLVQVSLINHQIRRWSLDIRHLEGVPASTISVSSLNPSSPSLSIVRFIWTAFYSIKTYSDLLHQIVNQLALDALSKELNAHADLCEQLISFIPQLSVTTSFTMHMQAALLAQLTQSTNQLTRSTLVCSHISSSLTSFPLIHSLSE